MEESNFGIIKKPKKTVKKNSVSAKNAISGTKKKPFQEIKRCPQKDIITAPY